MVGDKIMLNKSDISGIMVEGLYEGVEIGKDDVGVDVGFQDLSKADLIVLASPYSSEFKSQPKSTDSEPSIPLWAIYGNDKIVSSGISPHRLEELGKQTRVVWSYRKPYILNGDRLIEVLI